MEIFLLILSFFLALFAFVPRIKFKHWTVQLFDYLRIQVLVITIICLVLVAFNFKNKLIGFTTLTLLLLTIFAQLRYLAPYFFFYPKEMLRIRSDKGLKVMVTNVLQENDEYEAYQKKVKFHQPDVLIVLESNSEWEKPLDQLKDILPNAVKCPKENLYGMHFYTHLKISASEIICRVDKDIPSIRACVTFEGRDISINCVHPSPPAPNESNTAEQKDTEFDRLAGELNEIDEPKVVCGDFNDVPWSAALKRFKKKVKLKDSRVGRGVYPTFHADYFFARYPLDHLFCSEEFKLISLKRVKIKGSDHFGMIYELGL